MQGRAAPRHPLRVGFVHGARRCTAGRLDQRTMNTAPQNRKAQESVDLALAAPVVGMAPDASVSGYRFVAADGGIFWFGSSSFAGSAA